ncbi:hypothetical protein GF111_23750 [Serratia sp. HRI]|nr:hypothetical protein [Serratia sp. HRI]UBI63801.1 hypothetical protein GF111_23750 [Serratia sp. HRI]
MRDFTPGERFETDINRLCALADTGVIRAAQRNIHQCKNDPVRGDHLGGVWPQEKGLSIKRLSLSLPDRGGIFRSFRVISSLLLSEIFCL